MERRYARKPLLIWGQLLPQLAKQANHWVLRVEMKFEPNVTSVSDAAINGYRLKKTIILGFAQAADLHIGIDPGKENLRRENASKTIR